MQLQKQSTDEREFLCEYYRIQELTSLDELISRHRQLSAEHPNHRFLLTLDDYGQASYTSMHSEMANDLNNGDWLEQEDINPDWLEDGYPREDLSLDQKWALRQLGFKHGLASTGFEDVFKKILVLEDESREEFIEANTNLLATMDKQAYLLKVPVKQSADCLMAFPNGYFSCDLSPFENYHLATHLKTNYGYELFGLGASCIAFIKTDEFKEENTEALLALLARLYIEDEDEALLTLLREQILHQPLLALRYTE